MKVRDVGDGAPQPLYSTLSTHRPHRPWRPTVTRTAPPAQALLAACLLATGLLPACLYAQDTGLEATRTNPLGGPGKTRNYLPHMTRPEV